MITHSHQLARAIAAGRVSQYRHARSTLKLGHDYPVQPALGKPAVCRVTITETRDQLAGEASFFDARAEGFKTTVEWKAAWVRQYDRPWVKRTADSSDDERAAERFDRHHTNTLTQVCTIKVLTDLPRYLPSQRDVLTGRSGQYTDKPGRAIDELEVIDDATMTRYALLAYEASEAKRQACRHEAERARSARRADRGRAFRAV